MLGLFGNMMHLRVGNSNILHVYGCVKQKSASR
jgi:hypothetical protein